eukprot:gnl/TRDRNA2_/TRDRNA2_162922_c0_seq2.p1 gnl/TRDRNA2_/TRDRNA2_162922_c0~~gnl/TRDRNA2_/TRDRNA2_162922_c0_seq2.p1  ORF type:complete len:610 (-),score=85.04 gnl/TRDRNA2_/TRDRNA2_162922_c0_seq2:73-1902(-)
MKTVDITDLCGGLPVAVQNLLTLLLIIAILIITVAPLLVSQFSSDPLCSDAAKTISKQCPIEPRGPTELFSVYCVMLILKIVSLDSKAVGITPATQRRCPGLVLFWLAEVWCSWGPLLFMLCTWFGSFQQMSDQISNQQAIGDDGFQSYFSGRKLEILQEGTTTKYFLLLENVTMTLDELSLHSCKRFDSFDDIQNFVHYAFGAGQMILFVLGAVLWGLGEIFKAKSHNPRGCMNFVSVEWATKGLGSTVLMGTIITAFDIIVEESRNISGMESGTEDFHQKVDELHTDIAKLRKELQTTFAAAQDLTLQDNADRSAQMARDINSRERCKPVWPAVLQSCAMALWASSAYVVVDPCLGDNQETGTGIFFGAIDLPGGMVWTQVMLYAGLVLASVTFLCLVGGLVSRNVGSNSLYYILGALLLYCIIFSKPSGYSPGLVFQQQRRLEEAVVNYYPLDKFGWIVESCMHDPFMALMVTMALYLIEYLLRLIGSCTPPSTEELDSFLTDCKKEVQRRSLEVVTIAPTDFIRDFASRSLPVPSDDDVSDDLGGWNDWKDRWDDRAKKKDEVLEVKGMFGGILEGMRTALGGSGSTRSPRYNRMDQEMKGPADA